MFCTWAFPTKDPVTVEFESEMVRASSLKDFPTAPAIWPVDTVGCHPMLCTCPLYWSTGMFKPYALSRYAARVAAQVLNKVTSAAHVEGDDSGLAEDVRPHDVVGCRGLREQRLVPVDVRRYGVDRGLQRVVGRIGMRHEATVAEELGPPIESTITYRKRTR